MRRFACCMTKATCTHSEYVKLIAFPRQQWIRERATMLTYTYTAYLVTPDFPQVWRSANFFDRAVNQKCM